MSTPLTGTTSGATARSGETVTSGETRPPRKTVVVVMGVSGSGKSTIAALLAARLGWTLTEADDLHGPANVAKMAAGTPLTDEDRDPWLRRICARIDQTEANQVVTCSALRQRYRDILRTADARVVFLHLDGSRDTIGGRLEARSDHFMPPTLLGSQLATLEPLTSEEAGARVSIDATPAEIVERAAEALGLLAPTAGGDRTR